MKPAWNSDGVAVAVAHADTFMRQGAAIEQVICGVRGCRITVCLEEREAIAIVGTADYAVGMGVEIVVGSYQQELYIKGYIVVGLEVAFYF